jgi:hypothetical protein
MIASFPSNVNLRRMQPVQRLPLLVKLTKRCSSCNHTLVKPEVKRADPTKDKHRDRDRLTYKIKLVASSYLPQVELGNRRRLRGTESMAAKRASAMHTSHQPTEAERVDTTRHSSLLSRTSEDSTKDSKDQGRSSMLQLRGIEESEELNALLRPGMSVSFSPCPI